MAEKRHTVFDKYYVPIMHTTKVVPTIDAANK
jgi:hypothetical protein